MEQFLMYLLFPQWQGAGHLPALAQGARRLAHLAPDLSWHEVPITATESLTVQGGILGRAPLLRHLKTVLALLAAQPPTRLFTLGGDCAAELVPIAALNARYGPELTLVWLDAHGDLNTPASSPSGTFHGMPLRHLLGEGDAEVLAALPSTLRPSQVVLAGVRELDPPEQAYVDAQGWIPVAAATLNAQPTAVGDLLTQRGARKLYVHLDLDVLDPTEFSALGWPTPGGLTLGALLSLLKDLHARFEVVGGGLTEYLPGAADQEERAAQVLHAWRGQEGEDDVVIAD
ncbi:arginase family protein [Deinococcus sp. QL22]|uniref:arginase family protein n=1 Tax=Deinococcus sp. QL22 TaxID=2939437 RepID=UPI0020177CFD|nr:arginase family protein [Deinococcus sp. QL22]UQN09465.1 arginase family protein [Deinococcus sp. QL22]